VWLDKVKKAYGDNLNITWRNFSLEQNAHNLKEGLDSDWKVWDQDDPSQGRSLLSQIAAEAAKRQEKGAGPWVLVPGSRTGPDQVQAACGATGCVGRVRGMRSRP